jgi:phosphoglycolate phosphatase-like HAD superfamily hydrolase
MDDLLKIATTTLTGMDVDAFRDEAAAWIAAARDPRWRRPYTDLTYLPQIELLNYLRGAGYKTYIVTGGGQDSCGRTRSASTASRPKASI